MIRTLYDIIIVYTLPPLRVHSYCKHVLPSLFPLSLSPSLAELTGQEHDRRVTVVGAVVLEPIHTEPVFGTGVEQRPCSSNGVATHRLGGVERVKFLHSLG